MKKFVHHAIHSGEEFFNKASLPKMKYERPNNSNAYAMWEHKISKIDYEIVQTL